MNRNYIFVAAALLGGAALYTFLTGKREEEAGGDVAVDSAGDLPPFPALEVQKGKYLATEAAQAFYAMQAAANADGVSLPISTAYRSKEYQQRLYDAYQLYKYGLGPWAPLAAKPGKSLHQKGIAIDFSGIDPAKSNYNAKRRAWLVANGPDYGFHNTGMNFKEPWHWVYGINDEGGKAVA